MAKSVGLIGTVIGKLGNAVGYRIKDSNNKMTQGFRVYQPNVSNPRTYAQAVQRARMKPINTFYRALKSIIDRGFEGKSYGNQCRLEFLRLAMQSFNGPYVPKGFNGLVPGPFTIANGSLAEIKGKRVSLGTPSIQTTLRVAANAELNTIGAVSAAIIASNPIVKEGDQITFVYFTLADSAYVVNQMSFVVDENSIEETTSFGTANDKGINYLILNNVDAHAVAIILSREGESGQHLRSKAVMAVAEDIVNTYFTDDAQAAAVASYMNADGTTDWPEVKFNSSDIAQLVAIEVNTDMTAVEVSAGTQALGFVTRTGENGVFFITSGNNKVLVKPDGTKLTSTAGGSAADVTLSADYAGLALEYSSAYGRL